MWRNLSIIYREGVDENFITCRIFHHQVNRTNLMKREFPKEKLTHSLCILSPLSPLHYIGEAAGRNKCSSAGSYDCHSSSHQILTYATTGAVALSSCNRLDGHTPTPRCTPSIDKVLARPRLVISEHWLFSHLNSTNSAWWQTWEASFGESIWTSSYTNMAPPAPQLWPAVDKHNQYFFTSLRQSRKPVCVCVCVRSNTFVLLPFPP